MDHRKQIFMDLPVFPSVHIDAQEYTVTKLTSESDSSYQCYYGAILREETEHIVFEDIVSGNIVRIKQPFKGTIETQVRLIKQVVDSTQHANFNYMKVKQQLITRWLEAPREYTVVLSIKPNNKGARLKEISRVTTND